MFEAEKPEVAKSYIAKYMNEKIKLEKKKKENEHLFFNLKQKYSKTEKKEKTDEIEKKIFENIKETFVLLDKIKKRYLSK